ncbi:hypothetical protein [Polaromonas sp. DSR2-3-2]|uniref:hypothetical protein n=1 Tax=unclassified Polaromonas TaxID=2638319 RepID=UPI003CF1E81B
MSEDKPHPITLDSLIFTKCLVESVPDYEPNGPISPSHPVNDITVNKVPGEVGGWVASMTSVCNANRGSDAPYHFDMQCMGIFHTDDTLTDEEAIRGVTITAHSVMYGAIRETVAWLTGRQVYGSMVLGLSVLRGSKEASKKSEQVE